MKDASSMPPDFNANYEERRKDFIPSKLRTAASKGKAAPQRAATRQENSPDQQAAANTDDNPGNTQGPNAATRS